MALADSASSAVWEGWVGLVVDGARLVSRAPLERMYRVDEITPDTARLSGANRELDAVLAAPLNDQKKLVLAAIAFREAYERVTDPS